MIKIVISGEVYSENNVFTDEHMNLSMKKEAIDKIRNLFKNNLISIIRIAHKLMRVQSLRSGS